MCIKGPESWWTAESITPQLVVNQSTTPFGVIDFAIHQLLGPLIHIPVWYINDFIIIFY